MSNRILATLAALLLLSYHSISQAPCAFDAVHHKLLERNAAYASKVSLNNASIERYIGQHPELIRPGRRSSREGRPAALYTIPVVVHVMHTGGAVGSIYNPTDAQILGAIDYLNDVFAGTYPGMLPPVEGGGVVDMEIQFALAQRTPSCGATNGINRVDASGLGNYTTNGVNAMSATGVDEEDLKDLARWNPSQYYNIWVVNRIDGADGTSGQFVAGYAYFPGAPASIDGTVMLATQMATGRKTLPHEIGHAFNLYHTFEGSAGTLIGQCPGGVCASSGDRVCDTDPVNNNVTGGVYNFACRTGATNQCTGGPYTINTENNFMAYTNCYTLFTNGQKGRVQAAMSLPERAGLVDPSNLALTPCGTTINFTAASSSRVELPAGSISGCRPYRDYTYPMSIGTAPSANAIVTLSTSGTATAGVDYVLSTNGDFTTPSNLLTFPVASTATRSFTIRVFDDGELESGETIIVDFTLNNGGGDATKGVIFPTFTLTLGDDDAAPTGDGNVIHYIGIGNTMLNQPFRGDYTDARTQFVFTKAQLNASGLVAPTSLTSLQFFMAIKNSTAPYSGFTVRLKNTSTSSLTGGPFETGATQVYTGNYTTVIGTNTVPFSTPFVWNGEDNLLVDICFNNTVAIQPDFVFGTQGIPQTQFERANTGAGCSFAIANTVFSSGGARPDMAFLGNAIPTSIETVAGSTASNYITSGDNEYFYSNNGRLMMRLESTNNQLECVSASLPVAGTTWQNFAGGQRSQKVFAVTPATNGATTNYTISLYFDNSELGGKNINNLRVAKSSAATIAGAGTGNTELVTPTITTLGSGTTVFTASFTGFSLFFLVDEAVTLPVTLTDFAARLNDRRNTLLSWETASEHNNRHFELETSTDGQRFATLSTVLSKGNSTTKQAYSYEHLRPQPGINWYRLKQVDLDGKFTYSNAVFVKVEQGNTKPFLFPVPAADRITVNFGKAVSGGMVEVYSADMRMVVREAVGQMVIQKEINISGLRPGVYFVKTGVDGKMMRFVKW